MLNSEDALNPTSISKFSNVPRAKIYEVLSKMIEKGIVMEVILENKKEYKAVQKDIVIEKLKIDFNEKINMFKSYIPKKETKNEEIWRLKTASTITSTMKQMILDAKSSILITLWKKDFYEFKNLLEEKERAGVNIRVHAIGHVETSIQNLQILSEPVGENSLEKWKLIIIDGNEIIFGGEDDNSTDSIRTNIKPLVNFFTEFFYHDIALTLIVEKYYSQFLKNDQKINDILTRLKY